MTTTLAAPERRVALCVALAAFVFQFEAFQVVVALPAITTQFAMQPAEGALVLVLYLLAATITFVPAGRWGDRHGLKKGFVAGSVLLAVGTLLCGLAPNSATLLAARVVQGAGGGCLAALGYALIPARLPRGRIGAALGMVSFAAATGLMTGAPVGGLMTSFLSWRWAILLTMPLAGGLAWCAHRFIPDDAPREKSAPSTSVLPGILLLSAALGGSLLGLGLAPVLGWRSAATLALLSVGVAAGVGLVWQERRAQTSLIDRRIWRSTGLVPALATLGLVRTAVGGIAFLTPFFLERVGGFSPAESGLAMLAYTLTCAATGLCAGPLSDRIGSRPLVMGGTLVGVLACAPLPVLMFGDSPGWLALKLGILGIGAGLFFSPNSRFTMACAPEHLTGEVAALMALALNVGTAVGVAVFSAICAGRPLASGDATSYVTSLWVATLLFGIATEVGRSTYIHPREELP